VTCDCENKKGAKGVGGGDPAPPFRGGVATGRSPAQCTQAVEVDGGSAKLRDFGRGCNLYRSGAKVFTPTRFRQREIRTHHDDVLCALERLHGRLNVGEAGLALEDLK